MGMIVRSGGGHASRLVEGEDGRPGLLAWIVALPRYYRRRWQWLVSDESFEKPVFSEYGLATGEWDGSGFKICVYQLVSNEKNSYIDQKVTEPHAVQRMGLVVDPSPNGTSQGDCQREKEGN